MYLISFRIFGVTVESAPSEACGTDEKIIESKDIKCNNYKASKNPGLTIAVLKKMKRSQPMAVIRPPAILRGLIGTSTGWLLFIHITTKSKGLLFYLQFTSLLHFPMPGL
jgi:hypothetical protein